MKKTFLSGMLVLGLVACGGGNPAPDLSYPYNPNANAQQNNDTRTPYRGDWVFVAQLADNSFRHGLVSITTKLNTVEILNAGAGPAAWCLDDKCTVITEQGRALIGTTATSQGAVLTVGMVPTNSTSPRFVMADLDGKATVSNNRASIAGDGLWVGTNGSEQGAVFAFVQVNTLSTVTAQQARQEAIISAQQLLRQSMSSQQAPVLNTVRSVLSKVLNR